MHRGACGVAALNARLQARLNPASDAKPAVMHGTETYRVGDRVMQTRNAYERQVFNGTWERSRT
jgi:exodeoxyribonuclease V alpha subunit